MPRAKRAFLHLTHSRNATILQQNFQMPGIVMRFLRFPRPGHLAAALALLSGPAWSETLERAVVNAILNSDARKAAQAELTATVSDLRETQSGFGATIGAYADIRMEAIDNPDRFPNGNGDTRLSREAGLTLRVPLSDGGQRAALVRRDAVAVDAEIIRLIDSTETLALNAVEAYIDLARQAGILTLAQANTRRHIALARQVRDQVSGGRLAASDGLRADERVTQARMTEQAAARARDDALARYKRHIGHAPKGGVALPRMIGAPGSQPALVQAALARSTQLDLIRKDIAALTHQSAADTAEYAPQLGLEGGVYAGADMDGTDGTESGAYLGLRMDWTLYKGGARKHREAANRDRIQRAHYLLHDQTRQITELAERSWTAYRKAAEDQALLRRQTGLTADLVGLYRNEFDAGTRPLLDVLEAERTLFNYRVQELNAHAALHFSLYKMLAVQTRLADHFGMAHAGRPLDADFEARATANPRAVFDITAPPLDN